MTRDVGDSGDCSPTPSPGIPPYPSLAWVHPTPSEALHPIWGSDDDHEINNFYERLWGILAYFQLRINCEIGQCSFSRELDGYRLVAYPQLCLKLRPTTDSH
jgi:hypothetical protein